MSARRWVRAGLIVLAVVQGFGGLAQLLLPQTFYEDFPASDHAWVAMLPPYNEHLMRDVGSLTLAHVLVLGVAAASMNALVVRTALAAGLVFAVPHFLFHATHLSHFPPRDAIGQTVALGIAVAGPALLLVLTGRAFATTPAASWTRGNADRADRGEPR